MKNYIFYTERLILRPLSLKDIEDVWEYDSDYEVIKYMYELSVKPEEKIQYKKTEDYLSLVENEWKKETPDFYEFAIELNQIPKNFREVKELENIKDLKLSDESEIEKNSRKTKVIGNICLFVDYEKCEAEFGWMLNRKFHKKGYATEAALFLKTFAFETLHLKKLVARCDERNLASRHVMEKLGMTLIWEHGYRKYPHTGEESTELMMEVKA